MSDINLTNEATHEERSMAEQDATHEARGTSTSEHFLTFKVADEDYGLPIVKVVEIIKMMQITAVPRMPGYVRGVINLRGRIIPVVDLRQRFGLADGEQTQRNCIVVVRLGNMETGLIVDQVLEVMAIPVGQIEKPPTFGGVESEFVQGIGKTKAGVILYLDIQKVLNPQDLALTTAA